MDGLSSLFSLPFAPAESGGSFAPPGGQQEPDPRVSADADGRRRPGRTHTAQTGRLQRPVGGANGQGKARVTRPLVYFSIISLFYFMNQSS